MIKNSIYTKCIFKYGIVTLIIISLLSACGKSEKQPEAQQQSVKQEGKYDKAPEKLKSIENNIEKIFKELEGPSVNLEEKKEGGSSQNQQSQQTQQSQQSQSGKTQQGSQNQGSQNSSQSQSGQSSQNQSNQQSKGSQQKSNKQQSTPPKPTPKNPWKEIDKIIYNLHYQWNDYMPEVVKKSTDRKVPDGFSTALNKLTETIKSKDKVKTLEATNALYASIPDIYSLYKTQMSPEIKRMTYLVRNAILASSVNNWPQAAKDMEVIKPSWSMFKNTLEKDQQNDSDKLDLSLYEFEKVVQSKNMPLTDIKGRVTLSNIEAIEKSFAKKEKESSGNK